MHEMVNHRNEDKLIGHLIYLTVALYCSLHFSLIMLVRRLNLVNAVCASHALGLSIMPFPGTLYMRVACPDIPVHPRAELNPHLYACFSALCICICGVCYSFSIAIFQSKKC